jgi:hypothetical protein
MTNLTDILELEDKGDFEKAFESYRDLYATKNNDYETWKYFYFFLWTAIEDAPSDFQKKINLRQRLQEMFDDGKSKFNEVADFNFIAGWTVSIFPYEYGDYDDLERQGKEMLLRATKTEPTNLIFKLAYLGSFENVDKTQLRNVEIKASSIVQEKFKGNGLLNKYFRQVLDRAGKEASR